MEIIKIIGEYIKNFADTLIQSIKKTKEKNNKLLNLQPWKVAASWDKSQFIHYEFTDLNEIVYHDMARHTHEIIFDSHWTSQASSLH